MHRKYVTMAVKSQPCTSACTKTGGSPRFDGIWMGTLDRETETSITVNILDQMKQV